MATPKQTESNERLVTGQHLPEEDSYELKLRPRLLKEFVGQSKVKENLTVAIEAARSRGEALDHILLYGPPGLGKTTLASIIANELGVAYQQTSGPTLQIKGDLTAILTNVQDKQVLFFDEVHRYDEDLDGWKLLTYMRPIVSARPDEDEATAIRREEARALAMDVKARLDSRSNWAVGLRHPLARPAWMQRMKGGGN